ncbi:hypothetical protein NYZ18_18695, partial [Acinetobacter baumannii]|nr:hypothetical protein [Acinetobacter baumannii]
ESYGLNAFPLPAEIQTTLGLNMFWHRSRNTHPMLVWARGLFRQVVAEFVGVPVPGLPQRMAEIEREQV